jgi:hypothetical protein
MAKAYKKDKPLEKHKSFSAITETNREGKKIGHFIIEEIKREAKKVRPLIKKDEYRPFETFRDNLKRALLGYNEQSFLRFRNDEGKTKRR